MFFSFYCTQAETKSALLSIKSVYSENTSWLPIFVDPFYRMHTQAPKKSNLLFSDSHFEPKLTRLFVLSSYWQGLQQCEFGYFKISQKEKISLSPLRIFKRILTGSTGNSKKEGPQTPQTGSSKHEDGFFFLYIPTEPAQWLSHKPAARASFMGVQVV